MSNVPVTPRWRILVTPRWLSWHLFAIVAVTGMIWLGDWQLRRALAGNTLSWAYTFEWPIFAIFGVVFWVKTVKDELRPAAPRDANRAADIVLPGGSDPAVTGQAVPGHGDGSEPAGGAQATGSPATGSPASGDPASDDPADQELAEYNAYLARLSSEVKGHGRWHGLR